MQYWLAGNGQGINVMNDSVIAALISAGVTLATMSISTWLQRRKWLDGEMPKSRAEASEAFANAASKTADTNIKLQEQINANQDAIARLQEHDAENDAKIASLEDDNYRANKRISELETDNVLLMQRVAGLEIEKAQMKQRISELETENAELRKLLGKPPRRGTGPLTNPTGA